LSNKTEIIKSKLFRYIVTFLIFASISIIIQSYQISRQSFLLGADSFWHMNRIYEAMMQIRNNNYSYFISIYGFEQSARIVNALYGPGMSYVLGVFLLFTGSWVRFQIVTSFLINIISAFGIYRILRMVKVKYNISIMLSVLYMTYWHVIAFNLRGGFFSFAAMIVPYVLYYAFEVNYKKNFNYIGLGLVMAIAVQTHMFTALLAAVALFPLFIIALKKDNFRYIFSRVYLAVGIALILSLNFWYGFFSIMSNNNIILTSPRDLADGAISFFVQNPQSQRNLGLVFTLILLGYIAYVFVSGKSKISMIDYKITIVATIFLFISSRFFPWSVVNILIPPIRSLLQFPSRIIVVPIILVLVLLGITIENIKNEKICKFSIILLSIGIILQIGIAQNQILQQSNIFSGVNVIDDRNTTINTGITNSELRAMFRSSNPSDAIVAMNKPTPDYLPVGHNEVNVHNYTQFNAWGQFRDQIINNREGFTYEVINGGIEVSWTSIDADTIQLPIIVYSGTKVELNNEVINHPDTTDIGSLIVQPEIGENIVRITYPTGNLFGLLIKCTIILFPIFIVLSMLYSYKLKENKN